MRKKLVDAIKKYNTRFYGPEPKQIPEYQELMDKEFKDTELTRLVRFDEIQKVVKLLFKIGKGTEAVCVMALMLEKSILHNKFEEDHLMSKYLVSKALRKGRINKASAQQSPNSTYK